MLLFLVHLEIVLESENVTLKFIKNWTKKYIENTNTVHKNNTFIQKPVYMCSRNKYIKFNAFRVH